MAVLSQMTEIPSQKSGHRPAWIMLEVQRDRVANLNAFIRDVRGEELKWAEIPGITIARRTYYFENSGHDLVEFDFIKEPEHLFARQVFLRSGSCVLNFMLNTQQESDQARFDEFLKSIRIEP
jgi:hypothetical protein